MNLTPESLRKLKVEMFATPDDMPALEAWIELHAPGDKLHLYTAAMMSRNLILEALAVELEHENDPS